MDCFMHGFVLSITKILLDGKDALLIDAVVANIMSNGFVKVDVLDLKYQKQNILAKVRYLVP